MRFIDLSGLQISCEWKQKAAQALVEVEALLDEDRAKEINRRRGIWSELKSRLEQLSHKKCWYCESRQIRSDMQVDHYRPKNRVSESGCTDHPGYWWLAFDWRNFRYCCTYCNCHRTDAKTGQTGGKADHFPLHDEMKRCCTPQHFISDEQPVLLDPTVAADPGLLSFNEDGTAAPTYPESTAPWLHRRAKESIAIYHLNHADLKEARQAVCMECKRKVTEGDQAYGNTVTAQQWQRIGSNGLSLTCGNN